ncbi:hydrolase, TatD family [Vulcanisaeta distributa DSM 14429]|uniref:Hydrolase, TatD family n=2 Tax=Vulcanisaeta distributa TaxID=164451 RepID=E1QRY0_VULDI|nr:hydrolase, TatD family [Vulcanisaeta distributa DSM 14429]
MHIMLYDAHTHLHEFLDSRIAEFVREIMIAAVSDDYPSSRRTIDLSNNYENIVPCVGIHPWNVDKVGLDELRQVEKLLSEAKCIGEVGLDRRFVPQTFNRQVEFFQTFVSWARDYDLPLNIHAPDAWRDVLEMVRRADVDRVLFHWYTGPLNLIQELRDYGYYISINAAIKIQEKSKAVAKEAPLDMILLESDGPYEYRGITLEPPMVKDAARIIAEIKGISVEDLWDVVSSNFSRLFNL